MKKVLIVEDDLLVAELERDYLEADGFEVVLCDNGSQGLSLAQAKPFDLILLDVMLPGMSGFDVCRALRKQSNVPIILVTARQEDVDKIRGLGLGADDYIVKPFSPSELVARAKAHVAMHERLLKDAATATRDADNLEFGDLSICLSRRRVCVREREVSLTNKEFELLCLLASRPGVVFTKDALFEQVWGLDSNGDTATVTVHVNRLREKIEDDPAAPIYILTVWGVGYRFSDAQSLENV